MRFWGVDPGRKSPGWHGDFSPGFSDLELVSRQRFFRPRILNVATALRWSVESAMLNYGTYICVCLVGDGKSGGFVKWEVPPNHPFCWDFPLL